MEACVLRDIIDEIRVYPAFRLKHPSDYFYAPSLGIYLVFVYFLDWF